MLSKAARNFPALMLKTCVFRNSSTALANVNLEKKCRHLEMKSPRQRKSTQKGASMQILNLRQLLQLVFRTR